jgi:hypothetical protein
MVHLRIRLSQAVVLLAVLVAGSSTAAAQPVPNQVSPKPDQALLFKDATCRGPHMTVTANKALPKLSSSGDAYDNAISCIKIYCEGTYHPTPPKDVSVHVWAYLDAKYGGSSENFHCGTERGTFILTGTWNDSISSLKVLRQEKFASGPK